MNTRMKKALIAALSLLFFTSLVISQDFSLGEYQFKFKDSKWYRISPNEEEYEIIPERLMVRMATKKSPTADDFSLLGIKNIKKISKRFLCDYYSIELEKSDNPFLAAEKLYNSKEFEYVQFVTIGKTHSTPDDPDDTEYSSNQWNLKSDKLNMPAAWDITFGDSSIVVAVIDDGIDIDHSDLNNNIWNNPLEYSGTADYDDDGNGHIDDINGWNWVADNADDSSDVEHDCDHGTNEAGIIAAETDNNTCVAGIAGGWNGEGGIKLMALRVWGTYHSLTTDNVAAAITYAAEEGADVINMAFEIGEDTGISDAIDSAHDDYGCVLVSSTGNDSWTSMLRFPASHLKTIAVGASTTSDSHLTTSNCGAETGKDKIDVVAPQGVYTTEQGGSCYDNFTMTSAACAHVSGLAALILSIKDDLSPSEVKEIITSSAEEVGGYTYTNGWNNYMGYGRINAYDALIYTLENYGGSNETFTFTNDVILHSSNTLTLDTGSTVRIDPDLSITVYGTLEANDVTFKCYTSAAEWEGLEFNGSGSDASELVDCIIQEVETGISIVSSDMTVETTEIYDALDYGIYIYSGSPEIYDCYIHDTDDYGIAANAAGSSTYIQQNTIEDCKGGVYAYGQNSIKLRGSASRSYGKNLIQSYTQSGSNTYGVLVTGGTPDLGQASPLNERGKNDFIYNSKYIVYNSTASEVVAEKNYWGGTPLSSWFYGSVGYNPYYTYSQSAGSSLDKSSILDGDKQLLADANELQDAKKYHAASETYKRLIYEYPDSRYAGIALAWAMAAHNEAGDLSSQRDYLQKMTKHQNQKVIDKAWLWLQTLEAKAGNKKECESIVTNISIDDPIGVELRLNWANDLYNIYNDTLSAQVIFDELITAKSDDEAIINTIEAIIKTARIVDESKSLPKLVEGESIVIQEYALYNYPNPFNPSTTIQFSLADDGIATLQIYDVLGRHIQTLIDGEASEGVHSIQWNGKNSAGVNVAVGIYFARLKTGNAVKTRKLLLVR